jgi:hypothetical protein
MSDRSYDPNVIIKAADDRLAANDLDGGQMLFQSALLDWVDDARENVRSSKDPEQMREAIATLWIAYAHYLCRAKQFKSATEAYEQAVDCPVAGGVGRIWLGTFVVLCCVALCLRRFYWFGTTIIIRMTQYLLSKSHTILVSI